MNRIPESETTTQPLPDKKLVAVVERSTEFDEQYYQQFCSGNKAQCVEHFLTIGAQNGCNPNEQFDCAFYLKHYVDVANAGINPFLHWLLSGKKEERFINRDEYEIQIVRKSNLFDAEYYIQHAGDTPEIHKDPIAHYVKKGWKQNQKPRPNFDPRFYATYYEDVGRAEGNPFIHFILFGQNEHRIPSPETATPESLIANSGYFNEEYYRGQATVPVNESAIQHFLQQPNSALKNPSVRFECAFYLDRYVDVADSGGNPLVHWLSHGRMEGRKATRLEYEKELIFKSGLFDESYYLEHNADVATGAGDPISHFLTHGCAEGRRPAPFFDPTFYTQEYADVDAETMNTFVHYIEIGRQENRACTPETKYVSLISDSPYFDEAFYSAQVDIPEGLSPAQHFYESGAEPQANPSKEFDCTFYLEQYPDVKKSNVNPLLHWLVSGQKENRYINRVEYETRIIESSNMFNLEFYTNTYNDIDWNEINPIRHFILYGVGEGRRPFAEFDPTFYCDFYKDVKHNPLVHWIQHGRNEGRFINQFERDIHFIRKSGLFDNEYYLGNNPDVKASGSDPIAHFVMHGFREGRKPSQWFDPLFYMLQYEDVKTSNQNPFAHYIEFGKNEGRETIEHINNVVPFTPVSFPDISQRKIAVLIHGFYDDLIEELLEYTQNIKGTYDVLLSVTSDEGTRIAKTWAEKNHHKGELLIKNAPNKGRDMAPTLITFREEILSYDYVCKIHTKKSLYTGKEQSHWRNELISPLLGSEKTVNNILTLFEESKNLGVVYPECKTFPYWAYTWLSNHGSASRLMKKLGINIPIHGYIDYPLGSMFWFHPAALHQLFEGRIKLSDFPDEPIPNDGTMAHALERIFALLAKHNNYTYSEVNLHDRRFLYGFGSKNFAQYTSKTLDIAREQIRQADTVSFDIFDTLITRPLLSPDSLFDLIEQEIDKKFDTSSQYHAIRKKAEQLARQRKRADVDYDDIYQEMSLQKLLSEEIIQYAYQREFEFECEITRPRPEMIDLFNFSIEQNKRVILASDMYLKASHVKQLLSLNQINGYHKLYLSSEINLRKDLGTMWDHLITAEKIHGSNFIHFGDNEHSDIQLSGDRKINNFHVMSPSNMFFNSDAGRPFQHKSKGNTFLSVAFGPVIERLYANPFIGKKQFRLNKKFNTPFDTGYCAFGPPVMHFMVWLTSQIAANKNDAVFFLAREGHFLKEIYDRFVGLPQVKQLLTPQPPTEYMLISRRAVLGALDKNLALIEQIIKSNEFEGTVEDLVQNRFGFIIPEKYDSIRSQQVKIPRDTKIVLQALNPLLDEMTELALTEKKALLEYLSNIQFQSALRPAVVDLGYAGTIQRYLGDLTNKPIDGYYFATNMKSKQWATAQNAPHGCFVSNAAMNAKAPLYRFSLLLEAWLTSPVGQLTHFSIENGTLQPNFKEAESLKSMFKINEQITAGVIGYITDMVNICGTNLKTLFNTTGHDIQSLYEQAVKCDLWDNESRKIFHLENDFCGVPDFDIIKHYKNVLSK
ncbi:MAG: hypothetical protein JXX29_22435 [Deltaproteobacteria bacterium]|nr:hypothetical protein [Deltaproteobacteria bacterium]MBN2674455.1 hypothetical protein [Deltaproteobacteria bacterium]